MVVQQNLLNMLWGLKGRNEKERKSNKEEERRDGQVSESMTTEESQLASTQHTFKSLNKFFFIWLKILNYLFRDIF